jgi:hypothetical protein
VQCLTGIEMKVERLKQQPAAADQRQPLAVKQPHA